MSAPRRLNVGLVIWRLDVRGGAQRQAVELAHALAPTATVRVYAWFFDPEACYADRLTGLQVVAAGRHNWRDRLERWGGRGRWRYAVATWLTLWGRTRSARQVADLVQPDTDVLNLHDHHMPEVAMWAKRRLPNLRAVWMLNDLPLPFQSLARADAARGIGRWLRRAVWALEAARERRLVRWVDEICVLDEAKAEQVRRYYRREARVIRSGADLDQFASAPAPRDYAVPVILAVGILFRYRRYEDLLDAAARLRARGRRARVRIIGSPQFDPAYARDLAARARALGLADDVAFEGAVDEATLRRAYAEADVFVFASSQTWGLAVFEAMAAGLPVVVSRAAGAAEVLRDGETALLVPGGDPDALARAIARLIDDPGLRARIGAAGTAYVRAELTWEAYARRMLAVFAPADLQAA